MMNDRHRDQSEAAKPGRNICFTIPRSKQRGVVLAEGEWRHEGAEIEFLERLFEIGAGLWSEGKLWWDGNEFHTGIRPAPPGSMPTIQL